MTTQFPCPKCSRFMNPYKGCTWCQQKIVELLKKILNGK